jgi:5-methylcytosine-specific restriction endonuclease McrA
MTSQRARKAQADAEYARTRAQRFVQARGQCEFDDQMTLVRCLRPATETHHVVRRSQGVDHGVANLRALCAGHHSYLHANVAWAKANGWIRVEWPQL